MTSADRVTTSDLDVRAYDPWNCAISEHPYPWFAALREQSPVHFVQNRGLWLLTRFDDVQEAVRDTDTFSSSFVYVGNPITPPTIEELEANWSPLTHDGDPAEDVVSDVPVDPALMVAGDDTQMLASLAESDPPEHTRIRRMLTRPMSVNRIANLDQEIRAVVDELFDQLASQVREHGAADLKEVFANPLTLRVSGLLMNIPAGDVAMLGKLAEDSLALFSLVPAMRRAAEQGAYQPYARYFRDRYTARISAVPTDGRADLMQSLLQPDDNGDRMSEEEFAANAAVVFRAGFETTTHLLTSGVLALFNNPDQLQLLRSNPDLIPAAVEEMLRYDAPVRGLVRVTTRDVTLHGTTIPQGSFVQLMFGSANRDGSHYPDPDRFLVERNPRDHMAFGAFKHLCLGANLARLEARIALEALLQRTRNLRQAGPAPATRHVIVWGRNHLPVSFDTA